MLKKLISLLLATILAISLAACSLSDEKADTTGSGKEQLNILCYAFDRDILRGNVSFPNYVRRFQEQYNVEVKLETLGTGNMSEEDMADFEKKVATSFYASDGPELVFITNATHLVNSMVKQSAVDDANGKISNTGKIYAALLGKKIYYVPIGMAPITEQFNKKMLDELGMREVRPDLTKEGYYEIRDRWLAKAPRILAWRDFNYTLDKYLDQDKIYDSTSNRVTLDTPAVKEALKNIHDEIYNNYKLDKSYTYKNYYNMLYVPESKEYKNLEKLYFSPGYKTQSLWGQISGENGNMLFARNIQAALLSDVEVIPQYSNGKMSLKTCGFLVNKKGKNLELAYKFIDGLLDNEAQLDMMKPGKIFQYYPVNKDIEEEIKNTDFQEKYDEHAIATRDYMLDMIKNGKCELYLDTDGTEHGASSKWNGLYDRLTKEMIKLIFADKPYSDAELSGELKKLENELNIWLNE